MIIGVAVIIIIVIMIIAIMNMMIFIITPKNEQTQLDILIWNER